MVSCCDDATVEYFFFIFVSKTTGDIRVFNIIVRMNSKKGLPSRYHRGTEAIYESKKNEKKNIIHLVFTQK